MARATECHLELLIGKRVLDADGEPVGRLEEVVAELVDDEYVVREFHIGAFAALERLGAGMLGRSVLRLVGGKRFYNGYVIPWELMDLTNPGGPRVTVVKRELLTSRTDQHSRTPTRARPAARGGRQKRRSV